MNIKPVLNFNNHINVVQDKSLLNARNMKINNDNSAMTNEEGIIINAKLQEFLEKTYIKGFVIKFAIPTTNELVLFITPVEEENGYSKIIRFAEDDRTPYVVITDLILQEHSEMSGTFTYNAYKELIIAFSEFGENGVIPFKTINLGVYGEESPDKDLGNDLYSSTTIIDIPDLTYEFINENSSLKGWYFFYIRYKITDREYTSWYQLGVPIYLNENNNVDVLEHYFSTNPNIIRDDYEGYINGEVNTYLWSLAPVQLRNYPPLKHFIKPQNYETINKYCVSKYLATSGDSTANTIQLNLTNINREYQIAYAIINKGNTDCYISRDLTDDKFVINPNIDDTYSIDDIIFSENIAIFNIKNLVNYKNAIYLANYSEYEKDYNFANSLIKDIQVDLIISESSETEDFKEIIYIENNNIVKTEIKKPTYKNVFNLDIPDGSIINVKNLISTNLTNEFGETNFRLMGKAINSNRYLYSPYKYIETNKTVNCDDICDIKQLSNVKNINLVNITDSEHNNIYTEYHLFYNNVLDDLNVAGDTTEVYDDSYILDYIILRGQSFYYSGSNLTVYKNTLINPKPINVNKIDNFNKTFSTITPYNLYIHFVDKYGNVLDGININDQVHGETENFINCGRVKISSEFKIKHLILANEELYNYVDDRFYSKDYLLNFIKAVINTDFDNYKELPIVSLLNSIPFSGLEYGYYVDFQNKNKINVFIDSEGNRFPIITAFELDKNYSLDINLNIDIAEYKYYFISCEPVERVLQTTMVSIKDTDSLNTHYISNDSDLLWKDKSSLNFNYVYSIPYDKPEADICNMYSYGANEDIKYGNFKIKATDDRCNIFTKITNISLYPNEVATQSEQPHLIITTSQEIQDGIFNLYNFKNEYYVNDNKTLYKISNYLSFNKTHNIADLKFNTSNNTLIYDKDVYLDKIAAIGYYRIKTNGEITENDKFVFEKISDEYNKPVLKCYYYPKPASAVAEEYISYRDGRPTQNNFPIKPVGSENQIFKIGNYIELLDMMDTFQYDQYDMDNPTSENIKTNTNFKSYIPKNTKFTKTIRRSRTIQDESIYNSWRSLMVESYKEITENKGDITNIIGIGTVFIIHTEHSMFMLDTSNNLKTLDENVQLYMPDAFDVEYKEVFTSTNGYAGLQDKESQIVVDNQGYYFYDTDSNSFYQFNNNQLFKIDDSIRLWLDYFKPYNVRFVNDQDNNRLLISLEINYKDTIYTETLSYSYKTNSFISFHDYKFTKGYNTKNKLYLQHEVNNKSSLHNFIENDNYGKYDIATSDDTKEIFDSEISIIINTEYEVIKLLEFIKYKLRKVLFTRDNPNSPVEERQDLYSGDEIQIYNNLCDTKDINIKVEELNKFNQYDKPYFDLGSWFFNYFRNNINTENETMNRMIHGNYFIIKFNFKNDDNKLIELSYIDAKMSKIHEN